MLETDSSKFRKFIIGPSVDEASYQGKFSFDLNVSYDDNKIDVRIYPIKPVEYIEFNFIIKSNNKLKLDDKLFEL